MTKESSSPCLTPVLFLQHARWIAFPADPCSLSTGREHGKPQPTEKEKAEDSQNKK